MKTIEIYTACADNSGARRAAGEKVGVGKGEDEIATDRAKALVGDGSAADASPSGKASKEG